MERQRRLSRRDLLRIAGLGLAATATGCVASPKPKEATEPEGAPEPKETTGGEKDLGARIEEAARTTLTVVKRPLKAVASVVPPTQEAILENLRILGRRKIEGASCRTWGIPETIDPGHQVLVAKDPFTNTLSLRTESWLAEPGVLLVGPDFEPETFYQAEGHIEYISPVNQQVFENETAAFNVPEGGFMLATAAQMTVELGDMGVELQGREGHNWMFIVRGLFADGKQDSDRNTTARFSEYVPGHIQAMRYPQGAFISEGQFRQIAELSHLGGTNCGAEGCSKLSVALLDLNTQAFSVVHQEQVGADWESVFTNW